jgi:hypothetical protein
MKHSIYILAICLGALMPAAPASAEVINLNYISVATGVDNGPEDGVFDSFTIYNLGSVNNNGWTSFRTAFEFNLSGLPAGFTVNKANLAISIANFDGTRTIGVHGYKGDGTVQLSDFSLNGQVGTATVSPDGSQMFNIDVTDFVANAVANEWTFAGFNVREEPANTSNFEIMQLTLTGTPLLSIELAQIVDIDIKPGSVPNRINLRSKGKITVAILSSPTFYAPSEVDPTSLTFGRTGNEPSLAFCNKTPEDMNGDGLPDMVCHFKTQATGFLSGDTQGVLKGKTLSEVPIKGTDSVRIVR